MKTFKTLALTGLACTMPLATANATMLTGGFTGNWYNPETSGQGIQLQVLHNGDAIVLWHTYDASGNQVWLYGNDTIVGNKVTMEMLRPVGAKFGPDFSRQDVQMLPFGSVTLSFESCDKGLLTWQSDDPQFGFGEMEIQRLTKSAGVSCTASLADNRSGDDPVLDFKVALLNDSPYRDAKAKAEYESRPGRVEFEVEIEDVPVGDYLLLVDGVERGTIRVEWDDDETEGYIEFSSPQDDDDFLLDFEPLGAVIEISDGTSILFSGVLDPELSPGNGSGESSGPETPSFGAYDIEIDLDNTGLDPDAYGDLELDVYPDRVEFEVEVDDLDVGVYELWVGELMRGEINVIRYDGDTEGELEFSNPAESGKLLLDFDPRGQLITVEQGGNIFLSAQFPVEGTPDDEDDMTTEDDDDVTMEDDDVTNDDDDDVTNDDDDATNDDGDDDVTNDDDDATNDDGDDDVTNDDGDATNDDGDDDVTNDDDDATNDDGDDDVTNDDDDATDGDDDDGDEDDATDDEEDEDDGDDDETDEDDDGDV